MIMLNISAEDDLSLVFDALFPVRAKWPMVCCSLGLCASLLDAIKMNHPGDVEGCLFEGLQRWVLKDYDTTKHGLPSWRNLVAAVDAPAGGCNPALALKIAEEHKGEYTHTHTHIYMYLHSCNA